METQAQQDFMLFYQQYYQLVIRYLLRRMPNREDAADLAQDVFSACFRYWPQYDAERCSLKSWLFVILTSRLKNYYRHNACVSAYAQISLDADEEQLPDNPCEQAFHFLEQREILSNALQVLKPVARQIVILRYFEGLSHAEIAQKLNMTSGNVRVVLSRALQQMQNIISEQK